MNRPKGWAMFCMGIWLSGMVFVAIVATQNFWTIDRLIAASANPVFRDAVGTLENPTARELMRYLSSELNRLYFQWWNLAELAVGLLALWFVSKVPKSTKATWGIVAMLGVVLFLMIAVTPWIVSIGREFDFLPREPAPPRLRKFGLLHAAYSSFTLVNLILGSLVTVWIQKTE